MFLSSLKLTVSNPGFTFGYKPDAKLSCCGSFCLSLIDISLFFIHPIVFQFKISILKNQQEGLKASRDLGQSEKFRKNSRKILKLKRQFYAFKKLELNLETITQMTLSVLLYLYSISSTRTSHSLLSIFNKVEILNY